MKLTSVMYKNNVNVREKKVDKKREYVELNLQPTEILILNRYYTKLKRDSLLSEKNFLGLKAIMILWLSSNILARTQQQLQLMEMQRNTMKANTREPFPQQ